VTFFLSEESSFSLFATSSELTNSFFSTALFVTASSAFVPQQPKFSKVSTLYAKSGVYGAEVDPLGNNVAVKNLLEQVESNRLLTQVAASGLLSKAQQAGISLSKVEKLLELAADNPDILILVEASGPELLPILPTVVNLAPGALPLLAAAVSIPPPLIAFVGLGALAAAGGAVVAIPDDSVANVALQTLIVGLSVPAAVAAFAGSAVLGQLTK